MSVCSGITKAGNIITVDYVAADGTRGASWSDPYRLVDILDTSVANGWGVTVQSGTDFSHYFIPYAVYIQGADTYFLWQDEGAMIETTETYFLYVYQCNFRSINTVKVQNIITSSSYKQCHFNAEEATLEDTIIHGAYRKYFYNNTKFNRVLLYGGQLILTYDGVEYEDVTINDSNYGIYPSGNFASANRITVINCQRAIVYTGEYDVDLSNIKVIDSIFVDLSFRAQGNGKRMNLTDCQVDVTSVEKVEYAGNNDLTLNLLSTFKINITNGDGGTATLYDQFGNVVATQTLSGEWEVADKVLYYKRYYETSGGVETADDITEYFPFSLVVTKTGKQTLTVPGINIEAGEITHVRAGMIDVLEYTEALIEGTIDEENFDFEFKEEEFTFEIN